MAQMLRSSHFYSTENSPDTDSQKTILETKIQQLENMLRKKNSYVRRLKKEKLESAKEIQFLKEQNLNYNRVEDDTVSYGSPKGLYTYLDSGSIDVELVDFTTKDIDIDDKSEQEKNNYGDKIEINYQGEAREKNNS